MFDKAARRVIDPPLNFVGQYVAGLGFSANFVTLSGLLPAIGAFIALWQGAFVLALVCIIINRMLDGLDGAVARAKGPTDLGGYLDIVLDFLFYSLIPLGFVLHDPVQNAVMGAVLIYAFIGTGCSFLTFAIIAEKRKISTEIRGKKSFYYLGGLTEGTETIGCFIVMCLFPSYFPVIAGIFAGLCFVTTITRIYAAFDVFKDPA